LGVHVPPSAPAIVPPPHTFGCPAPPQMAGEVHAPPQETVPPQPSAIDPQFMPAGQLVMGVQGGAPHTFSVPAPPQSWPAGHASPQSRMPPQPSEILPQFLPCRAHVVLTHAPPSAPTTLPPPHTLGVPPPQVCGNVQLPQLAVTPPQPFG
jgi:hypothetical protein